MQVSSTNLSQIAYSETTPASLSPQKNSSEEAAETAAQKAAESAGQGDTVKLSLYMQAKLLRKEGYSIAQISNQLGVDAKTVNGYFSEQASVTPTMYTPSSGKSGPGSA